MARELSCSVYRGGNSKTLIFRDEDLPADQDERDKIFLYAIGCPDPLRLNGLGGTTINQNKVVIISKSELKGIDVEYTLGQIGLTTPCVEYSYNSGNIAFAVALYAAQSGMTDAVAGEREVKIYNTNAKEYINAQFISFGNEPGGAQIRLNFLSPGGGMTGSLFPTGSLTDNVEINNACFRVTVIDAGNLTVLVNASDLGVSGTETSEAQVAHILAPLEKVCDLIASRLAVEPRLIKTIIVAPPQSYVSRTSMQIDKNDISLCARDITLGSFHPGFPVTGAIAVSIAAVIPGTVANEMVNVENNEGLIKIGTASGIFEIGAWTSKEDGKFRAEKITLVDSARAIMRGKVWVP